MLKIGQAAGKYLHSQGFGAIEATFGRRHKVPSEQFDLCKTHIWQLWWFDMQGRFRLLLGIQGKDYNGKDFKDF